MDQPTSHKLVISDITENKPQENIIEELDAKFFNSLKQKESLDIEYRRLLKMMKRLDNDKEMK